MGKRDLGCADDDLDFILEGPGVDLPYTGRGAVSIRRYNQYG